MERFEIESLAEPATAAAAQFHAHFLPLIEIGLMIGSGGVTIVMPPADHSHHAWRLAAIASLAREHAPSRINAVSGADPRAVLEAVRYLEAAEGVTGQLLMVDGTGAGDVVELSQ